MKKTKDRDGTILSETHVERLEKEAGPDSRVSEIFAKLESVLPAQAQDDKSGELSLEAQHFREIVRRSIADASGHLDLASQVDTSQQQIPTRVTVASVFKDIKKALLDKGSSPEDATQYYLDMIPTYTKGIVQTPHPTEMLGREAIEAESKFLQVLEKDGGLLFKQPNLNIEPEEYFKKLKEPAQERIKDALDNLYKEISPVAEGMEINEEMARSTVFSQRMFDAIPVVLDRLLVPTGKTTEEMNPEELAQFGNLLLGMTWSPGDQDNKARMTVERLEEGYDLNRRAMFKHYAMALVKVLDKLPEQGPQEILAKRSQIARVVQRLFASAKEHETPEILEEFPENKDNRAYINGALGRAVKERKYPVGNESILDVADFPTKDAIEPYATPKEFIDELENLRNLGFAINEPAKINGESLKSVGQIDALIAQAHNFGFQALKSQIRQNSEEHEKVFKRLQEVLGAKGIQIDTADKLIDEMKGDGAGAIRDAIDEEIGRIKEDAERIRDEAESESPLYYQSKDAASELDTATEDKSHVTDFYFLQTMETMRFAAEHSDFIPHYLIAECGIRNNGEGNQTFEELASQGRDDMMMALALMKTREPQGKNVPPVEIVPLVEHPQQLLENEDKQIPFVEMMKRVMTDPSFVEHQTRVTESQYAHLLKQSDMDKDGSVVKRNVTGVDILRSVNSTIDAEGRDKPIAMAKMIMGAGSDAMKFGGPAAAALMQNAMFKLKEELAAMDTPVLVMDYMGCGGGLHRTQPVSSDIETNQGRSMRESANNIATKTTALFARHIYKRVDKLLGLERNIVKPVRNMLAQLNFGNMANLPRDPEVWENFSRELMEDSAKAYKDFTWTKEYTSMLSFASGAFFDLTKFAARKGTRMRSEGESAEPTFPPKQEIGGMRAIGYGATLNASGSCAGLYLGLGTMADKLSSGGFTLDALAEAYGKDTLLQDTLNRATYGIAMSDMKAAWKYVGVNEVPGKDKLEAWANTTHEAEYKDSDASQKLAMARTALAKVTLEREAVGNMLVAMHEKVSGLQAPEDGDVSDRLRSDIMPRELASQITHSRDNLKQPRTALAELFKKALLNNDVIGQDDYKPDPDGLSPDLVKQIKQFESKEFTRKVNGEDGKEAEQLTAAYKNIVYPAMATIFEAHEHAPRAATSPHWGAVQSARYGKDRPGMNNYIGSAGQAVAV